MGSIGVVVADPTTDPCSCLTAGLEGIEVDAFVFQRSPQPLDEDVVHPAATTIHRDTDVGILQGVGEGKAGELRALIRVEDLRLAEARDGLLQRRWPIPYAGAIDPAACRGSGLLSAVVLESTVQL